MRLLPVLLCLSSSVSAQEFDFYARGPYRAAVPRPENVLGYHVGAGRPCTTSSRRCSTR
jgi:hypothetical protein